MPIEAAYCRHSGFGILTFYIAKTNNIVLCDFLKKVCVAGAAQTNWM